MTLEQVARTFDARRCQDGYRAKCPVHKSRGLTLSLWQDEDWVRMKCYAGCERRDILASVGLKIRDMALREREASTPETRQRMRDESRLASLDKRELDCIANQYFHEPHRKAYWRVAEQRVHAEWQELWDKMHPTEAAERKRMEKVHAAIKRYGHDEFTRRFKLTDAWKNFTESVPLRNL